MSKALTDTNLIELEQELIALLKELYVWHPDRYRTIGVVLLKLQKADGGDTRYPYDDQTLYALAREAGILKKKKAKRAPSLLYLCLQLARDIPNPDFTLYRQHKLSWTKIRLVLRAVGRGCSPEDRQDVLAKVRPLLKKKSGAFRKAVKRIFPTKPSKTAAKR